MEEKTSFEKKFYYAIEKYLYCYKLDGKDHTDILDEVVNEFEVELKKRFTQEGCNLENTKIEELIKKLP